MKLKLDFNKLIEIKKLWQGNLNVVYLHNHKKQLGSTYICSSIPCETFCAPTIGYTGRVLAERGHLAVRRYRNRNILLYFMFSFQVTCGHSKSLFIVEIPLKCHKNSLEQFKKMSQLNFKIVKMHSLIHFEF